MKILIIDDHPLFSDGLKLLISDIQENVRIKCALTIEAIDSLEEDFTPDLILLDYYLRETTTGNAIQRLKAQFSNANIVIISSEESATIIRKTLNDGADGYISKSSEPQILISALKLVLSGGTYIPNQSRLFASKEQQSKESHISLTQRQKQALALAIQGKANKVIALELGVAEGTVKAHLSAAFQTLGVSNRTEASISPHAKSLLNN